MKLSQALLFDEGDGPRAPRRSLDDIFEEEPVSLEIFIRDKGFLGSNWMLSEKQAELVRFGERVLLPETFETMAVEFGGYWADPIRMVNLISAEWGKGGGKDHTVRIVSLRVAYLLLCLKNPQEYFGMPEQDSIHMLNIAANAPQAMRAFFKPMTQAVKRGWFKDKAHPTRDAIQYAKNLEAISGHSDAEAQEGLNLILGVADEIDAFKARDEMVGAGKKAREASTSAESILNMLKTSASTRFPLSYKRIAISYPRYQGSTIQRQTAEGKQDMAEMGEQSVYFASGPFPTWVVNPLRKKEHFANDYRKNPDEAAAKYECKPTRAVDAYFRNPETIKQAFSGEQPIQVDYRLATVTSKKTGKTVTGWEPVFTFAPDFKPIPGARYAMHGDLALKGDRAGIAMSHVERWEERTEQIEAEDGEIVESEAEVVPVVRNDFTIGFEADMGIKPIPREIQIRWARMLCFELIKRGFFIASFTFDGFQCLSGDTRIPLLDGTTKTMRELEGSDPFWVYSIRDGRVVPGLATKAWRTGFRDDMVEVILDNGESIRATSDHRFMLRDGSYRMASDLKSGDSLMPLYRRMKKVSPTSAEYEQVWMPEPDASGRRWKFTHSVVSHDQYGKLPKGWLTHHMDHSKTNNSPENLLQMTVEEHGHIHNALISDTFEKLWQDPTWRAEHVARLSARRTAEQTGLRGTQTKRYRHDISFEDVKRAHAQVVSDGRVPTKKVVSDLLGCSPDVLYGRVRAHGFSSWKKFRDAHEQVSDFALYMREWKAKQRIANNHKVVEVRPSYPEDVYDLEVRDHHNFATEAGVFVHNSADTIQTLKMHGIESKRISTDVDPSIWKSIKDLFVESRVSMPWVQLLRDEILGLSRIENGKVDHPPNGSKDLADAFACSVVGAIVVGGQEDEGGSEFSTGESYFDTGESLTPLEGYEDMELLGGAFSMPIGLKGGFGG